MPAALALNPLAAHDVRVGGRRVLFHVPTTALFDLDPLGAEVLDLFKERPRVTADDVRRRFDGRYPPDAVRETLEELLDLEVLTDGSGAGAARPRARLRIRETPLSTLVLNVNTGCNLSCTYCYKEDLATPADGERMDLETATRAVDLLLAEGASRERVNVVFFGGEPLSNLPLIREVVAYAERRCAEAGKTPDFSLTTNATLLDEATVEWLDAHRFSIAVSIDGPAAVHDRHRLTVGGKGTYEVVARKVRLLLERYRSRPVGARVTLTRGVTDVVGIHRHLRDELGFFEVGFAPVTSGPLAHYNLEGEDLAAVFEGFERLGGAYLEAALADRNIGFSNLHQLMSDLHEGSRKTLPCGAGVGMLAVDKAGDLHLCHRFTGSALPTYGNVATGINRPRLSGFLERAAARDEPGCATCRIRNLCAGGCYHESYARWNDPLRPTWHYCDIMRRWVDFGIGVYARIAAGNPSFFDRHVTPRRAAP